MAGNSENDSSAPAGALSGPPGATYATASAIHLVRTAQLQGLHLSQMADQKASILMGATFLVFSIAVSRSVAGHLTWSLGLLATFAFLSSLCAVLAVIPSTKRADPAKIAANPLFFGHFTEMSEEEWTATVLGALRKDEDVYRMMLHDIYQNGQVLAGRKYRYLGYAYRMFVAGLLISMLSFGVELALGY